MATTTITTTGAEDARIIAAVGDRLHLGRNATQAEVKAALATVLQGWVQDYEWRVQVAAISLTLIQPS